MEKLSLIIEWYKGLGKRGKSLAIVAGAVVAIALLELFTGCSNVSATKTWSF
jgi:hypothetical protein|tara:strand:- start:328 stop:483 length:156 start_codon:yes stop_codon:yes gene_type:complete